jgi:uncharacterized protein (TIGR03437 family)
MKKSSLIPVLTAVLLATGAIGQNVSPTINDFATRQFGQSPNVAPFSQPISTTSPNLVEGRELDSPFAIAFDRTTSPPILYVVDSLNNRVLAFKNPNNLTGCGISAPTSCGMADLVIGQRDFFSTQQGGPGRPGLNRGFALPISVAVDASGALYVYDAGNNRIVRFPSPFKQTVSPLITDLVIGQKTVDTGILANQGQSGPDNTTLSVGTNVPAGIAIEPVTGNLWVSDYGNNRVLRFPTNQLVAGTILPKADFVLGQTGFSTGTPITVPPGTQPVLDKALIQNPTGITFDSEGNLYVADAYSRVLFFNAGFAAFGQSASRVLGVCNPNVSPTNVCTNPSLNGYTLNTPTGLFTDGSHLFVADTGNHRIAMYDKHQNWPDPPNPGVVPQIAQDSPPIQAVFGQTDPKTGNKPNRGQADPGPNTIDLPVGGAFNGSDMWVVDSSNHRILGFQGQSGTASYLVGQLDFVYRAPNLIEGREVFLSPGNQVGGDVAIDNNSSPPHLYIADTFNNRILGFKDARNVQAGQKADIVIGQTDLTGKPGSAFYRNLINNPNNDVALPSASGLNQPVGVMVDGNGNLWVADSGNARVLRFPQPFAAGVTTQTPTIVIGQQDFTSANTDASSTGMQFPYGMVLLPNSGALVVSDVALNRLTVYRKPAGGDFRSSVAADVVLGQQSPNNSLPSNSTAGLNVPRHIGADSSDRVYVADSNNNRLVVFNNPSTAVTGAASALQLPMPSPQGVAVSLVTGESWITLGNALWRLPEYNTLVQINNPNLQFFTQQLILQSLPFSIALDKNANLIVGESVNRATFYYAKLTYTNAANYNGGTAAGVYVTPAAPGQLMEVYRVGQPFSFTTASAPADPWPTTLGDLQVSVNGVAAPIFRVDASDIAFQVPSATPPSGTVDFIVTRASTGDVVAAGSVPMQQYNPGFFASNSQGFGQVAALNDGGAGGINSQANPVSRDGTHYISFYLTGGGVFDGGPAPAPLDGYAPSDARGSATHDFPSLITIAGQVQSSAITYSGAGGFAGGWQINFTVPSITPVGQVLVVVTLNGIASNVGPGGQKTQLFFYTK